jgi:hypothetical protein
MDRRRATGVGLGYNIGMGRTNRKTEALTQRDAFWLRVTYSDHCWEWDAQRSPDGYGQARWNDRQYEQAHRRAWLLTRGPIPDGIRVLHHCDNPPCVRPTHLFLGTQLDNIRDMDAKGRRRSSSPTGANQKRAVLTPELGAEIKRRLITGTTQLELTNEYGISKGTIYNIARGLHWSVRV